MLQPISTHQSGQISELAALGMSSSRKHHQNTKTKKIHRQHTNEARVKTGRLINIDNDIDIATVLPSMNRTDGHEVENDPHQLNDSGYDENDEDVPVLLVVASSTTVKYN